MHGYALSNEKHEIVHVFIRFLAKTAFESLAERKESNLQRLKLLTGIRKSNLQLKSVITGNIINLNLYALLVNLKMDSFPSLRGVANSSVAQNVTGWLTNATCKH